MSLSTFGSIRKTEDGKVSVYDLISVVGGKKQPWDALKRLTEQYPEVLGKCEDWKFPGARQRNTPVTDKEGALYIISLLPGAVGKTYREEAAKLVLAFLENPEELANKAIDRIEDTEALKRVQLRAESKVMRRVLTDECQCRDVTNYGTVTNATYRGLLGTSAQQAKAARGLTKKDNLRDNLTDMELAGVRLAEYLAVEKMKLVDAQGDSETASCAYAAAKNVRAAIQDTLYGDIPVYDF